MAANIKSCASGEVPIDVEEEEEEEEGEEEEGEEEEEECKDRR